MPPITLVRELGEQNKVTLRHIGNKFITHQKLCQRGVLDVPAILETEPRSSIKTGNEILDTWHSLN